MDLPRGVAVCLVVVAASCAHHAEVVRPPEFDPSTMRGPACTSPRLTVPADVFRKAILSIPDGGSARRMVKCVVALDGKVSGCRVIERIPDMDQDPASLVERYQDVSCSPATLDGKPVEVEFTWSLTVERKGDQVVFKRTPEQ